MSTSDETRRSPVTAGARPATAGAARTAQRSGPGAPQRPASGGRPATAPVRTSTGQPAGRPPSSRGGPGAPRKVRLTVGRVDPWSVMKLAFLLSVAIGIATVVAAAVLWSLLDGMGAIDRVGGMLAEILGDAQFSLYDYIGFGRVVSLATVIAVVNVVLITAISTLAGFLYNIASSLVGGLHLTLTDD